MPLHSTPYALHQKRQRPRLYTLHPTLYTISASAPAPNLSPLALSPHLPARGSVLTQMPQADAGAVRSSAGQNRYLRPEGDIFGEWFGEHSKIVRRTLKSIWCALRRRMRAREMDKTGAVKSYLNGLWISHLSGYA